MGVGGTGQTIMEVFLGLKRSRAEVQRLDQDEMLS